MSRRTWIKVETGQESHEISSPETGVLSRTPEVVVRVEFDQGDHVRALLALKAAHLEAQKEIFDSMPSDVHWPEPSELGEDG